MKLSPLLWVVALVASCGGSSETPQSSGVKVVGHERLRELLPTLDGWSRRAEPQATIDLKKLASLK